MRRREMRRGQRERSGNWRADYLETRTVGSEEGGGKRAARAVPRQPPILLGTSVQEKTDLACPITIIPGHGTRLRDKGNLFFSLSERGKLHQARTTDPFWQHALRKTIWMPSERSSFEGIWTNDDGTLAQLDPLMHGRLRWILFTPPFGSHGAVRPRSE
jgi:hypothetical protein